MAVFPIIDTNVVVAGLLTSQPDSPVASILNGMLSARFSFVVSSALLAEYREVLLRPKLRKLHGLTTDEIDAVLTELARHAIVLSAVADGGSPAPDPGDQFLWDLLATRHDLILVTGDKLLLQDAGMGQRIRSPQQFVAQNKH